MRHDFVNFWIKEIQRRKAAGWAKKTITSVGAWWWLNVHDEKCSDGAETPDWLKGKPLVKMEEQYDELPNPSHPYNNPKTLV